MKLKVACVWSVKERRRQGWVEVLRRKNTFTSYGLTAVASRTFVDPVFLVIENATVTLANAYSAGATSIVLKNRIDQSGDNQLVLSPGAANQETVTFSSVTSIAPFTYTLTAGLVNNHSLNEIVVRNVRQADTMSTIIGEVQFDPTNNANKRLLSTGGYSTGTGIWTTQFYLTATMGVSYISGVGLADNSTLGQGNLFNHAILGYDHSGGTNDLEIDATLTVTNA